MPMNLTVTRNRKRSKNFNSEGHGVSMTVELDQGLLTRPDELRLEVDRLFNEAEAALDRQTEGTDETKPAPGCNGVPAMTDLQKWAITAIAQRLGLDPFKQARSILAVEFEDLSIRQASKLIDQLKSLQKATASGNSRNGGDP